MPLTGLARTTKGAWGLNQPPIDPIVTEFFLMLGDKETGGQVTGLALSIFMVNSESEFDPWGMTKPARD